MIIIIFVFIIRFWEEIKLMAYVNFDQKYKTKRMIKNDGIGDTVLYMFGTHNQIGSKIHTHTSKTL